MTLVALSEQNDFDLVHSEQDCRGWMVTGLDGQPLGTCEDLIVDTEAEQVVAIVLHNGEQIAVRDITLQDGKVVLRPAGGESRPRAGEVQAAPLSAGAPRSTAAAASRDVTLPVVEETIKIGKRQVAGGGVRVTQRVSERPVEETVRLRDEQVHVERRLVDRPADAGSLDTFEDRVIDVIETDEEAVVAKQARVVEEVVVGKNVTERQETVRDTVKRTDVEVEQLGADSNRT